MLKTYRNQQYKHVKRLRSNHHNNSIFFVSDKLVSHFWGLKKGLFIIVMIQIKPLIEQISRSLYRTADS